MIVRLAQIGVPNKNGHVYSADCFESALGKEFFGTIGMDDFNESVDLNRVSHRITNLRIEDGFLVGDVEILSTPMGKVLSEIGGMDYRTAGFADMDSNGIISKYQLISINAVENGA